MNGIEYTLPAAIDWHSLSARWILTLAHFLWEGALIGLAAAVALALTRRASSHVRHGISAAALLCLIPCLTVTFACIELSPGGAARLTADVDQVAEPNEPRVDEVHPAVADLPRLPIPPEIERVERTDLARPSTAATSDASINTVPPSMVPTEPTLLVRYAPWIAAAYAAVVLALLLRTGIGVWGGQRLRAASERVQDAGMLAALTRQAELIGLAAAPAVGWCRRVSVPTVVGIIKPIILLPATFATGLDSDQLAAILSHELAHIRRHDLLINLLQRVVESLLFFHPVAWWISRQVSIEREHCCDDVASATGFGNVQYAGSLLRMAELSAGARGRRFAGQVAALSADGARPSELSRRIERLLGMHSAPRLGASRLLAAATACVIVLGAATVGVLAQITGDDGGNADPANHAATKNEKPDDTDAPAKESTPRKGLEFLKPYPKLHGLSLGMTEEAFLAIAKRQKLNVQKHPGGRDYSISTGDGYTVIVMFGNNGDKCSGIQRIGVPHANGTGDGIYWSSEAEDGIRAGARPNAPNGRLKSGEPLEIQYVLRNESDAPKSLEVVPSKSVFPTLAEGNRIDLSLFPAAPKPVRLTLAPRQVLERADDRVTIDTTGLRSGRYVISGDSFFWRPDPDDSSRKHGIPFRRSMPLTIEPADESAATPKRAPALDRSESADIAWGKPVAGLQAGARFTGKSREFAAGAEPQVQLLVRNATGSQLDAEILMPHPADGWLLNVENERGGNVLLERSFLGIYAPEQSFRLTLKPGEAVPITGVKQQINGGSSDVDNASFQIAREKPASGFWRGGILISEGGNYNAVFTVSMKRLDIPGLRLSANAGELAFRVTDSGLKSDGQGSAALSDDVRNETDDASIKRWKARLIDGASGKPLAGIKVQAIEAVDGKDKPELTEFVSDDEGIFAVPVRDGKYATIKVLTPGWWEGGFQPVGNGRRSISKEDRKAAAPSPDQPVDIKLWRGQVVTGRLLYPDKSPAAGVLLNVGVYITDQEWKKRLGMSLNFHSFDHGEWPNWMCSVTTGDDGTFITTVPPKDARWWVRVGTTRLGFTAIAPARIDAGGTGRALATCVPFEVQIGGNKGIQPAAAKVPGALNFGDIQLESGVTVRGRVVDADGNGLEGIPLTTTGLHGPHSGRSARSGKDGEFRLQPIAPGSLTIHAHARLRDEKGQVISRGVRAVFIDRSYEIPDSDKPVELVVKAVPYVELEFEWRDRRAKEAPVSFYGEFIVRGYYLVDDGQRVHWHGETDLIERGGRKLLVVKVPKALQDPELLLPRDQVVTASYEDETGRKSGPGQVALGDITRPIRRTIFGDEPAKE